MVVAALAPLKECLTAIVSLALDAKLGCALEKQGRPLMYSMYIGLQLWLPDVDSVLLRIYTRGYKKPIMLTQQNPRGLGNCCKQFCFTYYQPELGLMLSKGQRLFYYQGSSKVECVLGLNGITILSKPSAVLK